MSLQSNKTDWNVHTRSQTKTVIKVTFLQRI